MLADFALSEGYSTGPLADELEITIIGPGFGEAVLVHLGNDRWLAIDCCADALGERPAPLAYLEAIGVNPVQVFGIVVSHWDDDHCRGIAELAQACSNAELILSQAFIEKDFLAFVAAHNTPLTRYVRSGVREIRTLMRLLDGGNREARGAFPNRRLFTSADIGLEPTNLIEVWSLSPSDQEYQNFIAWAASQMPKVGETRRVAVKRLRNDLSVVLHIAVGNDVLLLGGDLEEEGNPATGWSAILGLKARPTGKAAIFKVSHHGSKTGHHEQVPSELLNKDPIAVVAPFKNGSVSLPTKEDVERIIRFAPNAYSTASLTGRANPKRDAVVDKTIREVTKRFTTIKSEPGMIRLRKRIGSSEQWRVEQFGTASPLARIFSG